MVRGSEPIPLTFLPGGHGVALSEGHKEAARALADASRALAAGRPEEANPLLERAEVATLLGDQVALGRVELLLALGDTTGALTALARLDERGAPPLTQPQIERLRARALLEAGDEAGARAAWSRAFEAESLPHRRQEVKLEMIEALQAAGLLPPDAAPVDLMPEVLREASHPHERAPEDRTPEEAAAAGDALLGQGRSAEAAAAYAEALAGLVDETERRLLQQRRGVALFNVRRYGEARTAFERAGGHDEARFWVARAAAREGSVPEAMRIFAELGTSSDPDWASRALFLLGTLHDGRDEQQQARARFEQVAGYTVFPERVRDALWRLGWSDFQAARYTEARKHFLAMVASARAEGLDADSTRRARYWAARAGEQGDAKEAARAEFLTLAHEAPFSYYGLRAQQRLGKSFVSASSGATPLEPVGLAPGREGVAYWRLQRAALLVEAGLSELAALELRALADAPLPLADRIAIGRVMVAADDFAAAQRIVVEAAQAPLAEGLRPGYERLWWLAWPRAYPDAVVAVAELGVEPQLVWAIMREESSFRPRVRSSAGAVGLMQLMPETALRVARRANRPDPDEAALELPEVNVELGTRYLAELNERMNGRTSAMIASYNAGPRAVARWLEEAEPDVEDDVFVESMPYDQTQSYTRRVLRSYWLYDRLYQ